MTRKGRGRTKIQEKSAILKLLQVSCLCLPFFPEKPQAKLQQKRGWAWHLLLGPSSVRSCAGWPANLGILRETWIAVVK